MLLSGPNLKEVWPTIQHLSSFCKCINHCVFPLLHTEILQYKNLVSTIVQNSSSLLISSHAFLVMLLLKHSHFIIN